MSDFEKKYVSTNNRNGAPDYDEAFISGLQEDLVKDSPELGLISGALLAALAIGAHRADIVPRLLEHALDSIGGSSQHQHDAEAVRRTMNTFRSVLIIVWPFVGIPWCVPAALGMVSVLEARGLADVVATPPTLDGSGNNTLRLTRPELGPRDKDVGQQLLRRTYANVGNSEVQDMLRIYFPDFTNLTWSVVFGYSLAGTTATGVFEERQTQLILAAAIAASGATRQARSHLKAAEGLGNSTAAVAGVVKAAAELNTWNGIEIAAIINSD